jgi:hypothetical protein
METLLKLSTVVRSEISVVLNLTNPLKTPAAFTCLIDGVGLKGASSVTVGPGESLVYSLAYYPLISAALYSGTIKFINEKIGEWWYGLELEAIESPPRALEDMSCALGKYVTQTILLENPLSTDLEFDVLLSNTRDFRIMQADDDSTQPFDLLRTASKINIRARHSENISVIFWPSSVTQDIKTTIEFWNQDMGSILYNVRGTGRLPEVMDETVLYATINSNVSQSLVFINPLVDPITVSVKMFLDGDVSDTSLPRASNPKRRISTKSFAALTLITKKTKHTIAPQSRLEIPFMYHPTSMNNHTSARLVIEMSSQLSWVYPIKGIPEAAMSHSIQIIEARVRETARVEFSVTLDGYCKGDGVNYEDSAIFTLEKRKDSNAVDDIVLECLERQVRGADLTLKFHAKYTPKKTSMTPRHLLISKRTTLSRWRFPLKLIGLPPNPDDTILVDASGVSFNIACPSKTVDQAFTAFLTGGDVGFSVEPGTGVLNCEGDNTFVVGWDKEKIYHGKDVSGTLVIEVSDRLS